MSAENPTTCEAVEYRELTRFLGYRFGCDGSCWSRRKNGLGNGGGSKSVFADSWTQLRGRINDDGYRQVALKSADWPCHHPFVLHRLILEAFKGPCPPGMQCCHKPGVPKSSCRLEDVRWDTPKNNQADRITDGTNRSGERHAMAKLTWEKVDEIRGLHRQKMMLKSIAERYGVNITTIFKICHGKTWTRRP